MQIPEFLTLEVLTVLYLIALIVLLIYGYTLDWDGTDRGTIYVTLVTWFMILGWSGLLLAGEQSFSRFDGISHGATLYNILVVQTFVLWLLYIIVIPVLVLVFPARLRYKLKERRQRREEDKLSKQADKVEELHKLISDKQSVPLEKIAAHIGNNIEDTIALVKATDFCVLSADNNAAVNIEVLMSHLESQFKAVGMLDPQAFSQKLKVPQYIIRYYAKNLGGLATKSGTLLAPEYIRKHTTEKLRASGKLDPIEEARSTFKLQEDEIPKLRDIVRKFVFKIEMGEGGISAFETKKGIFLEKEWVFRSALETLRSKGVLNLINFSNKLFLHEKQFMREFVNRVRKDNSVHPIDGTSLVVTTSWREDLRNKLRAEGIVDPELFSRSIGITKKELESILSGFVMIPGDLQRQVKTVSDAKPAMEIKPKETTSGVSVTRGAEFIGNELRYKTKVENKSKHVITDVTVSLFSYPSESLKPIESKSRTFSKLEPGGFRSTTFSFLPTEDCVKGNLVSSISYLDSEGNPYSEVTKPYTIRAVCDLLTAETITPEEFMQRLSNFKHGELSVKVSDWTPEQMFKKTESILRKSNFYQIGSEEKQVGTHIESKLTGWAKGKYTGKRIAVEITITGKPETRGATCKVRMSAQDEAMIMPAIDEFTQRLTAWLCPYCVGILSQESVDSLKARKSTQCPFCGVLIDQQLVV
jgi:hypothetical protein